MLYDLGRDGAEEQTAEAAVASRSHDQEIRLLISSLWFIGLTAVVVLLFVTRTSRARRTARKAKHLLLREATAGSTAAR